MKKLVVASMVFATTLVALAQAPPKPAQNSQPQNAAPQGKVLPQAKSQPEYKAFQDAMAMIQQGDPVQGEAAANGFADKYKGSEISPVLYHRVLQFYQKNNNAEKATEMGKKILAMTPNDPIANVLVATMISERVRETDLDKDERLTEAENDAKRSLQTVDTDFLANPGTPQEHIDASKNMIRSMAYSALANVEAARSNFPAAENYYKQAVSLPGAQIDAVTWLRYALLLDNEKKYAEAMSVANKAYDAAPAGSQTQDLVKKERERLMMLSSSAPATQTSAPAKQ